MAALRRSCRLFAASSPASHASSSSTSQQQQQHSYSYSHHHRCFSSHRGSFSSSSSSTIDDAGYPRAHYGSTYEQSNSYGSGNSSSSSSRGHWDHHSGHYASHHYYHQQPAHLRNHTTKMTAALSGSAASHPMGGSSQRGQSSGSHSHSHGNSDNNSSSNHSKKKKKWSAKVNAHKPPKSGWCSYVYPMSLGVGLGVGMTVFSLLRDTIALDDSVPDGKKKNQKKAPLYSLDQATVICLVGVQGSGKSTQAARLADRFEGFEVISDVKTPEQFKEQVQKRIESAQRGGHGDQSSSGQGQEKTKEALLVVDGFPLSLEQAQQFEQQTCPIFVVLFFDLPKKDFQQRHPQGSESDFDSSTKSLEPLVNHFRHRGNILEISADWSSADEVWEQVEAKVEQVLELKAMGEDVSVSFSE